MATQHEMRRERRERDAVAIAALREGASDKVAAEASGLSLEMVGQLRRWLGLKAAHQPTPEMVSGTTKVEDVPAPTTPTRFVGQMRSEVLAHLGLHFVERVIGDDPIELQRAHAALRLVLLDADDLVESVRTALRIRDRQTLTARATSVGDAGEARAFGRAWKRSVVRGRGEAGS